MKLFECYLITERVDLIMCESNILKSTALFQMAPEILSFNFLVIIFN